MKNSQKGFIIPLLIIIAALVVGGGVYYYKTSQHNFTQVGTQSKISGNISSSPQNVMSAKDAYFDMITSKDNAQTFVEYLQAEEKYMPSVFRAKTEAQIKAYENPQFAYKMTPEQEQKFLENAKSVTPPASSIEVTNEETSNGITTLFLTSNDKQYTSSAGKIAFKKENNNWVIYETEFWLRNAPQTMIDSFIANPNWGQVLSNNP